MSGAPELAVGSCRILIGDCREALAALPEASVQCCVTSPPYFGLRDYGADGQIGLEATPDEFVADLVGVFREVRRVLRNDGTLWLNLGDSYAGSWGSQGRQGAGGEMAGRAVTTNRRAGYQIANARPPKPTGTGRIPAGSGLKPKDLMGIPWMAAFALRADGWYLRQEIIWHKPNPMPESVQDRCTKAHEQVFLLTKSPRYFFDAAAIAEPATGEAAGNKRGYSVDGQRPGENANLGGSLHKIGARDSRNRRSVWSLPTQPFAGAHFATMPPALADLCIRAGTRPGDMVLDPFGGAGTTGLVADRLQRRATLIEINPTYAAIARDRIAAEAGLFARPAE